MMKGYGKSPGPEAQMKTVGDKLEPFQVVGVKPGFKPPEEHGQSAFEDITETSFPGKWKVIYFYFYLLV